MTDSPIAQTGFTLRGATRGAAALAPVSVFVVPFGMSFGAAALAHGLDPAAIMLMSAVVFAGASQFAALDRWGDELSLLPIVLTVLAVNARHLILGVALAPWLLAVAPAPRLLTLAFLSDANFARAKAARDAGETDAAYILGAGMAIWTAWVLGTAVGVSVGAGLGNLAVYGLDAILVAYLAPLAVGFWEGRATLLPWLAAVGGAAAANLFLPAGWPVIAGALAGGFAGAARHVD